MIEEAREQRLFVGERLIVRPLPRGLEMAAPGVLARDRFRRDQRVEIGHRRSRHVEEFARARFPVPRDERRGIELQPGQHLAAVARAGAPAGALPLEDDDRRAGEREPPRCRQAGVAGADHDDVGFVWDFETAD